MYKDKGGKLFAGPVWDYDWGTFKYNNNFTIKNAIWYGRLFSDPAFVTQVKERWNNTKTKFEQIAADIDLEAEKIKISANSNFIRWDINNKEPINGDEKLPFRDAATKLKDVYLNRIQVLDRLINNLE